MAYEQPVLRVGTMVANVNLSSSQYCGVVVVANTSGSATENAAALALPAAAGANIVGVLQDNPIVGVAGNITSVGISKALAGGTIAINAALTVNTSGAFVTAATGNHIVGIALEAAVSGDIFTMFIQPNGISA